MTRLPLSLLLLSLLLAACGQPAASSPGAATPTVSTQGAPLYAINFEHIGQPGVAPASSITQITPALRAQGFTDVSDNGLTFAPLAVDTFLLNGTRHIRSVYRVTNTGTQPLTRLTFVPVNTDEDTDPTTTTSQTPPPTPGSSYFTRLTTYGGTDASSRASDLTPVAGKLLSIASGTVSAIPDPNATPYSALDTSALTPTVPVGQVIAGRAPGGWQLPAPLGAGQSALVTFAADLNNSTPVSDPFDFSVIVAVGRFTCSVDSVTVTPNAPTLAVAGTTTFKATVTTTPAECATTVRFASSDPSVATIDPATGVATGVKVGTTQITASVDLGSGAAVVTSAATALTVNNPDFSLALDPGSTSSYTIPYNTSRTITLPLTLSPSGGYSGIPTFTVTAEPAFPFHTVSGLTVVPTGAPNAYLVQITAKCTLNGNCTNQLTVNVRGQDGAIIRTSNAVRLRLN